MKGAGTNEQVIIDIITQRTCTERQEIIQCYNNEFNRVCVCVLKSFEKII